MPAVPRSGRRAANACAPPPTPPRPAAGFLSESKIPGSVPALSGIIPSYDGDYMQPFLPTGPDTSLWTIGNLWAN